MKARINRIFTIFLAISMIAGVLSSCAPRTEVTQEAEVPAENQARCS